MPEDDDQFTTAEIEKIVTANGRFRCETGKDGVVEIRRI